MHGLSGKPAEREMIKNLGKSVAQYFKDQYGITLKYPELPCVKVSFVLVFVSMLISTEAISEDEEWVRALCELEVGGS